MVMVSRLGLCFINPSFNATSLKALPPDKVRQGAGVAVFHIGRMAYARLLL